MSAEVNVESAPISEPRAWLTRSVLTLLLLAASHFLVDIVAGTTSPLWPTLEESLKLKTGGLLWVYVAWSIATSFSQLFFGIWGDRHYSRWLIWTGPILAILCLNSVGLATSPIMLAVLFVIGGLGVAAFHPEAAAMAGALLPEQRSRAMAIFALSGYLGQAAGPLYSGMMTHQLGLRGLLWGVAWGLPCLFVLYLGLRRVPLPPPSQTSRVGVPFVWRAHARLIILLLAVGTLRILPALGVPLALAYLLKATSASNVVIGAIQSAFMAGIGVGSMVCAAFVTRAWERRVLWIFPLGAAPILAILTLASDWTLVALVAVCGLLLGVTMPVYISYGQQILPQGQRVASAITMGVSWGIGGGIVAAAMDFFVRIDALSSIFGFFALAAVSSSLLCCLLPDPDAPRT